MIIGEKRDGRVNTGAYPVGGAIPRLVGEYHTTKGVNVVDGEDQSSKLHLDRRFQVMAGEML